MRNEYLTVNDHVMDRTDPKAPRIKDLPAYLEQTKQHANHRREILNTDFFHQMKTPALGGDGNSATQKVGDSNEPGEKSSFGQVYKNTFMKMMG